MGFKDVIKDIEGYKDVQQDIEVLRKYGSDFSSQKGVAGHIVSMLHPKSIRVRVSEIFDETASAKTIRIVSDNSWLPPFQAGQYINLFVEIDGIRTSRPYSISSSPARIGYYDITVRRNKDGFVSEYLLGHIRQGDIFESSGPSGNFIYNPLFHGDDLVFLAGGSGITPFMSMIRDVAEKGLQRNIHLVYGSLDQDDIIFHDELCTIANRHKNIRYTPVISNPPQGYDGLSGFITADLMKDLLGDISKKTIYMCGPEAMYVFCLKELDNLGVEKRKIRTEVFGPPADITQDPGWPSEIQADAEFTVKVHGGKTITARADEPLMISLERNGIVIPALCRSGECSLCRTRLIKGNVFQPQGVKVRKSDRAFGYIHACMAYPLSDLEIMF